jgi:hypothetical protein
MAMKIHNLLQMVSGLLITVLLLLSTPFSALAQTISPDGDDKVTGQLYVRHDGGSDIGISHCNNPGTDQAADNDPADPDVDSNDGGNRRQGNEPVAVIDPTNPSVIVAGWND